MNNIKQQSPIQVCLSIPENYHFARLESWNCNATFWSHYIDAEMPRAELLDQLARRASELARRVSTVPKIIDFGCGEGLLLRLCGKHMPEAELTGVDFSTGMLELARERTQMLPVTFRRGDIETETLNLAPEFDVAAAILTLDEVEDLVGSFRNITASLRPGGSALVAVLDNQTERLRHTAYLGAQNGLLGDETFLVIKHFNVGRQASPAPYNRIVRRTDNYIDAAKRSGLELEAKEIWPVGDALPSSVVGPMVQVLSFRKLTHMTE